MLKWISFLLLQVMLFNDVAVCGSNQARYLPLEGNVSPAVCFLAPESYFSEDNKAGLHRVINLLKRIEPETNYKGQSKIRREIREEMIRARNNPRALMNVDFLEKVYFDFAKTFPFLDIKQKQRYTNRLFIKFLALNSTLKRPLQALISGVDKVTRLEYLPFYIMSALIIFAAGIPLFAPAIATVIAVKAVRTYLYVRKRDKEIGVGIGAGGVANRWVNYIHIGEKADVQDVLGVIVHELMHSLPGYKETYFQDVLAMSYLEMLDVKASEYMRIRDIAERKVQAANTRKKKYTLYKERNSIEYRRFTQAFVDGRNIAGDKLSLEEVNRDLDNIALMYKEQVRMDKKKSKEPYYLNHALGGYAARKYQLMKKEKLYGDPNNLDAAFQGLLKDIYTFFLSNKYILKTAALDKAGINAFNPSFTRLFSSAV